jgi:integrase
MKGVYLQKNSKYYWIRIYDKSQPIASKRRVSVPTKILGTPRDWQEFHQARAENRRAKYTGNAAIAKLVKNVRQAVVIKNIEEQVQITLPHPISFKEAFNEMIIDRTYTGSPDAIRPKTRVMYESAAHHFIMALGDHPLSYYNPDSYKKLILYYHSIQLKQTSISIHTRTLKACFNWFIKKNLCAHNPIRVQQFEIADPKIIPQTDIDIILNHFSSKDEKYQYVFIMFLCLTGCRPSSAVVQLLSDIDFTNNIIFIQNVKTGHLKNTRAYSFPLYNKLADVLQPYIKTLPPVTTRLFPQFRYADTYNDSLKFFTRAIKLLTTSQNGAAPQLKQRYTLKQFRSSFASMLVNDKNISEARLARLLDHTKSETTHKHYVYYDMLKMKNLLDN